MLKKPYEDLSHHSKMLWRSQRGLYFILGRFVKWCNFEQNLGTNGTKCSRMDQEKFVRDKFEVIWSASADHRQKTDVENCLSKIALVNL